MKFVLKPEADADPTIRRRPPGTPRRRTALLATAGAAALGLAALLWFAAHPAPAPKPATRAIALAPAPPPTPQPAPPPVPQPIPAATEPEILRASPDVTEIRRFALQPDILILQFPSLEEQAATLNRTAALIERAGFPRDAVLDDAELDRRIRAGGDLPSTLYFGHDYRARDIVRFFRLAARTGLVLTPQERALQAAIARWGWTQDTNGALISLARANPDAGLDDAARATILRHELSHGLYFTSPGYAAYAAAFWHDTLTGPERAHFRAFLASEGYDATIEDLMINEGQAYLMHTPDARFFRASAIGITPARLDILRGLFLTGMPPSWLRDCTTLPTR